MKTTALAAVILICSCGETRPSGAAPAKAEAKSSRSIIEISPESPKLREIQVAEVKEAELPTDEFSAPGRIEENPNRVAKVLLPVPGRVAAVLVHFGDAVTQDQPVAEVESPEADEIASLYLQSDAAVSEAQANLSKAQADHDRAMDLFKGDAIAKKEVLQAENNLIHARAALKSAEASRAQNIARMQLLGMKAGGFRQRILVRAPISGKVTAIGVVAGEYRNDLADPLMTVADLSTVWISADVPESSIRNVSVGERFEVRLAAYPGELFLSRVTRISDTVDPASRTIEVWAELRNDKGRLRPNMFGEVRHIHGIRKLPAVPDMAVIQAQQRTVVYREIGKGRFEPVDVEVGKRFGNLIPVTKGLSIGDRVVSDGAMLLRGY